MHQYIYRYARAQIPKLKYLLPTGISANEEQEEEEEEEEFTS